MTVRERTATTIETSKEIPNHQQFKEQHIFQMNLYVDDTSTLTQSCSDIQMSELRVQLNR